jgi:amino acid transporter
LLARINNAGVIAELVGVVLLIGLLFAHARRGPAILLDAMGHGEGGTWGYLGPALTAALMASYVLYGFDTAGTLAEETGDPRRRAPRAILQALVAAAMIGALLIASAVLAVGDPSRPELGQIAGGLSLIVKEELGSGLGTLFLIDVVFAVFVCALAVHAGTVRLIFAMARDNNLPMAHALGRVPRRTQTPAIPALLVGVLAAGLLVLNINLPHVIETLCAVAIVWVNLAYLLVTLPMLVARMRGRWNPERRDPSGGRKLFSMDPLGLPINALASAWGLFVVLNISWPRTEIYGPDRWGRFAALLWTLVLLGSGGLYYGIVQRRRGVETLPEHRPDSREPGAPLAAPHPVLEGPCIGRLAAPE